MKWLASKASDGRYRQAYTQVSTRDPDGSDIESDEAGTADLSDDRPVGTRRPGYLQSSVLALQGTAGAAVVVILAVCGFAAITALVTFAWSAWSAGMQSRALVLASYSGMNTNWTSGLSNEWELYKYMLDDPTVQLSVSNPEGREGIAYLTYIIDHYESLPDIIVFMHGHFRSWHQSAPSTWLLEALDLVEVQRLGYVNLRCSSTPDCKGWQWAQLEYPEPENVTFRREFADALIGHVFQPDDAWYDERPGPIYNPATYPNLPVDFSSPCCAQFAATKEQIRKRPLAYWKRVREPLETHLPEIDRIWDSYDEKLKWKGLYWRLGTNYEQLWNIWFGKESSDCPNEAWCYNVLYHNKIRCSCAAARHKDFRQCKKNYCEFSPDGTWPDGSWGDDLIPTRTDVLLYSHTASLAVATGTAK